ncbi:MAG: SpoIIIAC/SpoIIIAD family protein [Clostridia bacterium]
MNGETVSIFIITIFIAILIIFIKQQREDIGISMTVITGVLIMLFLIKYIQPILSFIMNLSGTTSFDNEYIMLLLKILGISFVVQFACDICKDCGETSLSTHLESAGKVVILAMSLPIFEKIISIIMSTI